MNTQSEVPDKRVEESLRILKVTLALFVVIVVCIAVPVLLTPMPQPASAQFQWMPMPEPHHHPAQFHNWQKKVEVALPIVNRAQNREGETALQYSIYRLTQFLRVF